MKSLSLAVFLGFISAEEMDIFTHTNITPAEIDTLFNPTNKPEPTDPCCHDCTDGLEKYHSVDHIMNNCGEACMDPSKYWLYKLFEPGLEKSDTNTPCLDRKYDDYRNTPTHGFGPVKMTLDLYGPHKDLTDVASDCEAIGAQDSCDASDKCSWCKSAAVKSACKDLATAKSLPSAVFQCDKLSLLKDDDEHCEAHGDSGSCDGDDICSWCKSAAVASSCKSLKTAKALPAAVFACDKLEENAIFLN